MPSPRTWLLSSLAVLALALPAGAQDGGAPVTFSSFPAVLRFSAPRNAAAEPNSSWNSGPSDGVPVDFDRLLLQGKISGEGMAFEACLWEGADWSPWVRAKMDRLENGRFWASLPLAGHKGDVVRLRAVHVDPAQPVEVELYGVETGGGAGAPPEAPGPSSRVSPSQVPAAPPPSVRADAIKPQILPRESWGAARAKAPYNPMIPLRITVHHTATAQPMSREDAIQELKTIQRFHQNGRGWVDIGYQFLIDGGGRIWEGRPETVMGAHVLDRNEGNIGIALMGDFGPPRNQQPTPEQKRSLIKLSRWLAAAYGIKPDEDRFSGHRDQMPPAYTLCPGDLLWNQLGNIRDAVAAPGVQPRDPGSATAWSPKETMPSLSKSVLTRADRSTAALNLIRDVPDFFGARASRETLSAEAAP